MQDPTRPGTVEEIAASASAADEVFAKISARLKMVRHTVNSRSPAATGINEVLAGLETLRGVVSSMFRTTGHTRQALDRLGLVSTVEAAVREIAETP